MFDRKLINSILEAWTAVPREGARCADFDTLKQLIEFVFLLSLKTEEGRAIWARVTLFPKNEVGGEEYRHAPPDYFVEFGQAILMTPDSASRLAEASDPRTTSILVEKGHDGALYAWGLVYSARIDRGILSAVPSSYGFPRALTVTAERPGYLTISWGNEVMGRVVNGEFERSLPDVFAPSSLGQYFLEVVQNHPVHPGDSGAYWHLYRDCLQIVLHEARSRGHGGTIVWCPDSEIDMALRYVEGRNHLANISSLRVDLKEITSMLNQREMTTSEALLVKKRRILGRLELIAQLSVADGALLISDGFVPICFGSVLMGPEWSGDVLVGPADLGKNTAPVELSKFGTRHKSAANFVGELHRAVAFVISQDGGVRAFRRVGNALHFWKDCLSSLSV